MSEEQSTKKENAIQKETQESNNNKEEEKDNIKKEEEKEKENIKKEEKKEEENENIKKEEEKENIKEEELKEEENIKKEEEKENKKEKENMKEEEKNNPPKTTKGKNFNIDDYILMLSIGTGNFSEVHLVEHKTTKILYALKSFEKRRVESLHKERDVLMEKYALEKISPHKNIIG